MKKGNVARRRVEGAAPPAPAVTRIVVVNVRTSDVRTLQATRREDGGFRAHWPMIGDVGFDPTGRLESTKTGGAGSWLIVRDGESSAIVAAHERAKRGWAT
jgi:hypothetical protein